MKSKYDAAIERINVLEKYEKQEKERHSIELKQLAEENRTLKAELKEREKPVAEIERNLIVSKRYFLKSIL